MAVVDLWFHAFVIETEGIRTDSDGDYLDGEVHFDAVIDGKAQRGLVAMVKQAAGSTFDDALEVQWPTRLSGGCPTAGSVTAWSSTCGSA